MMGPRYRAAVSKKKEVFMPGNLIFSGVRPLTDVRVIARVAAEAALCRSVVNPEMTFD